MSILKCALTAGVLFLTLGPSQAHDPGFSNAHLRIENRQLTVECTFHKEDLALAGTPGEGELADAVARRVSLTFGEQSLSHLDWNATFSSHGDVHASTTTPLTGSGRLTFSVDFSQLPRGHRQLARLHRIGGQGKALLLSREQSVFECSVDRIGSSERPSVGASVENILDSDHTLLVIVFVLASAIMMKVARVWIKRGRSTSIDRSPPFMI